MRSRQLETALTEFVEAASSHLQAVLASGEEVPFELTSQAGRRGETLLYCYRPLTSAFIEERKAALGRLPSHAEAARLLEGFEGLDRYLMSEGVADARRTKGRGRAVAALSALLEDVFEEQTDFEPRPDRLYAALARLEDSAFASADEITLVATLHGLVIASDELALTRGLVIAQPGALRGVPDGVGSSAFAVAAGEGAVSGPDVPLGGAETAGHLLVVFTAEDPDVCGAIDRGRGVFRDLLRALRLFGDGRVTLGALAWAQVGAGSWNPVALGAGRRPHGMLVVTAEQEDELRAFCNLVSRRAPQDNELAWALRRFEMGCERASEYEALSDHLMALRALLESEGPASGLLAGRIAALCATPEDRAKLTKRMTKAQALERAVMAGTADERAAGLVLARDVADHLRALLRDVICGHLDPDLAVLADELLAPEEDSGEEVLDDSGEAGEVLDVLV